MPPTLTMEQIEASPAEALALALLQRLSERQAVRRGSVFVEVLMEATSRPPVHDRGPRRIFQLTRWGRQYAHAVPKAPTWLRHDAASVRTVR